MINQTPNIPRRIGWANLSLAIAFFLSFVFAPGGRVLALFIDAPVLQSIPVYKAQTLTAFANYWIPAIFVYLVLRAARVEVWLKPQQAIHVLIGVGNGLLILYLIPRIFASSIEGGGPSYVVAMLSPFFVIPAQLLFLIGFVWLAVRSISQRGEKQKRMPIGIGESVALAIVLAVPAAYASTMYFGENAPLRLAREANQTFQLKCQEAGESIVRQPSAPVKGLYLERDGGERYEQIRGGVYYSSGSGILGEPIVNSGLLLFMEKNNDRPRPEDGGQFKYRRHGLNDWKGEPVDQIESEYGLYHKDLTSEDERKLGIRGAEISIRDLKTTEVIATTTYFISSRERKFCGEAPNGYFAVSQFVTRALNLKKIYPSAWDKPAPQQK